MAEQICMLLTVHATIEEEIFYPAAREVLGKDEDLIDEADVEHARAMLQVRHGHDGHRRSTCRTQGGAAILLAIVNLLRRGSLR